MDGIDFKVLAQVLALLHNVGHGLEYVNLGIVDVDEAVHLIYCEISLSLLSDSGMEISPLFFSQDNLQTEPHLHTYGGRTLNNTCIGSHLGHEQGQFISEAAASQRVNCIGLELHLQGTPIKRGLACVMSQA